ncbi:MAG: hypothetical protein GY714_26350 [Desulfobacterales bacterium]|nr:hypothetical protein [Desulfobacterales bacterium]MCP4163661.1 hypothetical protein [Deltaproteobacteria bacterium]
MTENIKDDTWIYVVVQNPGAGNESYLAFSDDETEKGQYVPAFLDKDAALGWLYNFSSKNDGKYEVQAIYYDFLRDQVKESGYELVIK